MKNKIYFDYASTTPIAKEVKQDMTTALDDDLLGNASSLDHEFGLGASQAIELARQDIASLINAKIGEIIWTSGATESNNLALLGVCNFKPHDQPLRIVSSYAEHKSVIEPLMDLKRKGHHVELIEPNKHGYLEPTSIAKAMEGVPDFMVGAMDIVENYADPALFPGASEYDLRPKVYLIATGGTAVIFNTDKRVRKRKGKKKRAPELKNEFLRGPQGSQ